MYDLQEFHEMLTERLRTGTPAVSVTLAEASGSVPSVAGAKMLVSPEGRICGTVGGGKLEARALDVARAMLDGTDSRLTRLVRWSLSKDVGMTCGGSVSLYFEAFHVNTWHIVVFGAGHVAQALIRLLVRLDCRVTCIDPRADWLEHLPDSARLTRVQSSDLPAEVAHLPENAFILLMTMGHSSDSPILAEILRKPPFPYVGVIGSRAKALRLKQDLAEAGIPEDRRDAFLCPVGLDIGSNEPEEIAISVAAQLLQERGRLQERRSAASTGAAPASADPAA